MARRKRDKKSYGRSNIATDASRRSSRRKRCRSSKKLARKLRRQKSQCRVCKIASGGKKYLFDCGHVVHRRCLEPRRKYTARTCPNCSEKARVNKYPWRMGSDGTIESIEAILAKMTAVKVPPPLLPIKSPVYRRRYADVSSSDVNRNMDLDNQSAHSGNSSTYLPYTTYDFHIPTRELPSTSRVLDWISDLNNSGGYSIDPSSNFDPYSRNDSPSPSSNFDHSRKDSPSPSSNFDHSTTDSPDPTSGLDIPTIEEPGPSRILDNPSSDWDNTIEELLKLGKELGVDPQKWYFNSCGLPRCPEPLPPHEHEIILTDSSDDEL